MKLKKEKILPKVKAWLKENGKGALGGVLDTIGENIPIPIVGNIIEGIGEKLKSEGATPLEIAEFNVVAQDDLKELETMQANITERWSLDMKSDSWLSKNVRPITLINFLAIIDYVTIASVHDQEPSVQIISLLGAVGGTVFAAYFGLRSLVDKKKK